MEVLIVFLFSTVMIFIGFLLGLSIRIKNSEDDVKESFRRGYLDGYTDAVQEFPKMEMN
tara:strand:- start:138 stop:314 length:177 start_codon:yes stop_codon:yes gene_type:complete